MKKIGILIFVLLLGGSVILIKSDKKEQEETEEKEAVVLETTEEREEKELDKEEESNDEKGSYEDFECINDDVVFVLHFEDKDLPVVDPGDNDAYLRKDLYGQYCSMGTVFLDENSSEDSRNVLIYGHSSLNNELRFTFLKNYLDKEYALSHRILSIEKKHEVQRLQVFASFSIDLDQDDFREWMKCEWRNNEEFLKSIARFKERSVVDYQVEVDENDRIYTLVTCDMSQKNGRILVFYK